MAANEINERLAAQCWLRVEPTAEAGTPAKASKLSLRSIVGFEERLLIRDVFDGLILIPLEQEYSRAQTSLLVTGPNTVSDDTRESYPGAVAFLSAVEPIHLDWMGADFADWAPFSTDLVPDGFDLDRFNCIAVNLAGLTDAVDLCFSLWALPRFLAQTHVVASLPASGPPPPATGVVISYVPSADNSVAWFALGYDATNDRLVSTSISTATMFSDDGGDTWTLGGLTTGGTTAVVYSPSLVRWATVGANRILTSDDGGVTWDPRVPDAGSNNWSAITWSVRLSLFVAVATSGATSRCMISPDGITWTNQVSLPIGNTWRDVIDDGTQLIACGTACVATSLDGVTWTPQVSPVVPVGSSDTWGGLLVAEGALWMTGIGSSSPALAVTALSVDHGVTFALGSNVDGSTAGWQKQRWNSTRMIGMVSKGFGTNQFGVTLDAGASVQNTGPILTETVAGSASVPLYDRFVFVSNNAAGDRVIIATIV